jgi:hypothetical protein
MNIMPHKNTHYYLLKIARLSGWLLLPLMIIYIGTGFALCGMMGFGHWMDIRRALEIHKIFDWPLVALFLIHASLAGYFSFRRWGWIKRGKTNCRKAD